MSPSLLDITEERKELVAMIEDDGGELNKDSESKLARISEMLEKKTDRCGEFVDSLKGEIASAKEKIAELREYIKARENAIERLKSMVGEAMDNGKIKRFDGTLYSFVDAKRREMVMMENEDKVPPEFTTVETVVKIDKAALLRALKAGHPIPGVWIGHGKRSIQIKSKPVR